MLFLLSPAKSLDYETPPHVTSHSRPIFVDEAAELIDLLRRKTPAEIAKLMSISDALAALNVGRYAAWSTRFTAANSKQAVLGLRSSSSGARPMRRDCVTAWSHSAPSSRASMACVSGGWM